MFRLHPRWRNTLPVTITCVLLVYGIPVPCQLVSNGVERCTIRLRVTNLQVNAKIDPSLGLNQRLTNRTQICRYFVQSTDHPSPRQIHDIRYHTTGAQSGFWQRGRSNQRLNWRNDQRVVCKRSKLPTGSGGQVYYSKILAKYQSFVKKKLVRFLETKCKIVIQFQTVRYMQIERMQCLVE